MTSAQLKLPVLAAWVATAATVGIIVAIDKPNFWMLIVCLALVPAGIANWLWETPEAVPSELIAMARSRS